MTRVLFYNWVDYRDPEGRGGGVSVYQRNLMAALSQRAGVTAGFFCAGLSYDLGARRAPRWEPIAHGPNRDRPHHYDIVNSAALAPAHHGYGQPAQLSDPATEEAVCDMIASTGPWDVLHLNNLEGLPVDVLGALRDRFPGLRIVLSLHNYYPLCPQVNLWHQERETCTDYDAGRACVSCLPARHDARMLRLANALAYRLKRMGLEPGRPAFDLTFRWTLRLGGRTLRGMRRLGAAARRPPAAPGDLQALLPPDGRPFAARRAAMLAAINAHCDVVLCVSDAVRRIVVAHGLDPARAHVGYIGTREADAFARTAPRPVPQADDGTLTLAYLGYMRRDKGFHFLLQALESLPADMARRIRLVVAARRGDRTVMGRLADLGTRLVEVDHADGYTHDDLDRLLAGVDVGLIPVLWHDNLPQVAIEMHARHIPLLTSDMGGAQELGRCPDMVFPADDTAAFHDRLRAILAKEVDFDGYWAHARAPMNLAGHVDALLAHYRNGSPFAAR